MSYLILIRRKTGLLLSLVKGGLLFVLIIIGIVLTILCLLTCLQNMMQKMIHQVLIVEKQKGGIVAGGLEANGNSLGMFDLDGGALFP